jgi:hypothetical protein
MLDQSLLSTPAEPCAFATGLQRFARLERLCGVAHSAGFRRVKSKKAFARIRLARANPQIRIVRRPVFGPRTNCGTRLQGCATVTSPPRDTHDSVRAYPAASPDDPGSTPGAIAFGEAAATSMCKGSGAARRLRRRPDTLLGWPDAIASRRLGGSLLSHSAHHGRRQFQLR